MTVHRTNSGRDCVEVHNRLDKVVLVVAAQDDARAQTELTAGDARELARMLEEAAATGEQTPQAPGFRPFAPANRLWSRSSQASWTTT